MATLSRREFNSALLAGAAGVRSVFGLPPSMEDALKAGVQRCLIPCAVAVVATGDRIICGGAFGKRDSAA